MADVTDKVKKRLVEIKRIVELQKQSEIKPPLKIETGRVGKKLHRIPKDIDFEMKDGNTTYEVVSHFNSDGDEYFFNQVIRLLGQAEKTDL